MTLKPGICLPFWTQYVRSKNLGEKTSFPTSHTSIIRQTCHLMRSLFLFTASLLLFGRVAVIITSVGAANTGTSSFPQHSPPQPGLNASPHLTAPLAQTMYRDLDEDTAQEKQDEGSEEECLQHEDFSQILCKMATRKCIQVRKPISNGWRSLSRGRSRSRP